MKFLDTLVIQPAMVALISDFRQNLGFVPHFLPSHGMGWFEQQNIPYKREDLNLTQPHVFLMNIARKSVFDFGTSSPLGLEEVAT